MDISNFGIRVGHKCFAEVDMGAHGEAYNVVVSHSFVHVEPIEDNTPRAIARN